jgi:hypothetical protein
MARIKFEKVSALAEDDNEPVLVTADDVNEETILFNVVAVSHDFSYLARKSDVIDFFKAVRDMCG